MIKVKIDGKNHEIEENLTVEMYQKIKTNPIKYGDTLELLSLYLNLPPDDIRDLPLSEVNFVEGFISSQLLDASKPNTVTTIFTHEGIEYGLENDWNNIKWGQWADMEVFSQQDKVVDNIHNILAILYRPILSRNGNDYKLVPYKSVETLQRGGVFKSLPISCWYGVASFFLVISQEYINDIQSSLELKKRVATMTKPLHPILKKLPRWLLPKLLRDSILI